MKAFMAMLRHYVAPYRKYLGGSVLMNVLSAILNLFSFALIVPILKILFNIDGKVYSFIPWDTAAVGMKEKLLNNAYWFVTQHIAAHGAGVTLLLLCAFLPLLFHQLF